MTPSDKKLRELALAAEPDASRRDWYVVEQPWLPAGAEPYIVAGNPDPHGGLYVCDFVDAAIAGVEDKWTDDEWHSRNWALAEFIAAANPANILTLLSEKASEKARADAAEASVAVLVEHCIVLYVDCTTTPQCKYHYCAICGRNRDDVPVSEPIEHAADCPLHNLPASAQSHLQYVERLEGENAEQREQVAQWMIRHSYATGHGDSIADLLTELTAQHKERAQKAESDLAEARANARTPGNELLEFANEVMDACEVGSPEYRLAEFVWNIRQARSATSGEGES